MTAGRSAMIKRASFLLILLILNMGVWNADIQAQDGAKKRAGIPSAPKTEATDRGGIEGKASWYSSKDACGKKTNPHKGCPTASGKGLFELERKGALFVAVPKGSNRFGDRLRVTNILNGKSVIVEVLDTGGFRKYGRKIDLGKAAFARIAPLEQGVIKVKIEEIRS